jgi:hypothetical protein
LGAAEAGRTCGPAETGLAGAPAPETPGVTGAVSVLRCCLSEKKRFRGARLSSVASPAAVVVVAGVVLTAVVLVVEVAGVVSTAAVGCAVPTAVATKGEAVRGKAGASGSRLGASPAPRPPLFSTELERAPSSNLRAGACEISAPLGPPRRAHEGVGRV